MRKLSISLLLVMFSIVSYSQIVPILSPGFSGNIVIGQSNYHVSESIYTDEEIGSGNYIGAANAIDNIYFVANTIGINPTINNYEVYMKNVPLGTTLFTTDVYSTAGYTQVFNGTILAPTTGIVQVPLTLPFARTAGTNLQILLVRNDNVLHTGYNFDCAAGNTTGGILDPNVNSSRRYNGTVAPLSGSTVLTATNFRPAIIFQHTYAVDANVAFMETPQPTCFNTPQSISVYLVNEGSTNIAPGSAFTTLRIRGANDFTGTLANTGTIIPGSFEIITFNGINMNNAGINFDTAFVTLAGDGQVLNDTLSTSHETLTTHSTFPLIEDAEGAPLEVFGQAVPITGDQLWTLQFGPYSNGDQTTPLAPRPGSTTAYIFDSYSGSNSSGFESRLFSNCINISSVSSPLLSFWMSHDNYFVTDLDSLYVSVSTDRGSTWTRIAGFRRPDPAALVPEWRLETVNLTAFNGLTIMIGFEGVSKYGNAILLDEITISGSVPVSLLNFDARKNGAVNFLHWKTSNEINTSRFLIERSTDGGLTYTQIGSVPAAYNSNQQRTYAFTDLQPFKGNNYYRLKIMDADGIFRYSETRVLNNSGRSEMMVAPNPVRSEIKLSLAAEKAGKAEITVTDLMGRVVYRTSHNVPEGNNALRLHNNLPAGSYIITLHINGEKLVSRFHKM